MSPMDDVEDDARYPSNPYPPSHHHRHHPAHTQRPKPPIHSQFSRNFADQEDEEEDESNSDEINNDDKNNSSSNANNSGHHRPAGYTEEGEDEEAVDDDDESSMESRGKRRKLDNFEFVPRKQPPAAINANLKPHGVKNLPPDWSEDSTFVLLDAWGELFVKNGRKSLRSDEWSEVAKKVNLASRITRSDSQCRNRLDTLKKKYKKEKARTAEHANFKSDWVYFNKMDSLMPSPVPAPVPATKTSPLRLACGVDAGEYVFANSRVYLNRANAMDEMRDSPGDTGTDEERDDEDDDESDGLPPTMSERKKGRGQSGSFSSSSFRMLADSIHKFGEIYEKIESSKRHHMAELERMRKEFHRDLEAQKRQILERAQAEIVRIRQEEGEDEEEDMMADSSDSDEDTDDEIDGSAENLSG